MPGSPRRPDTTCAELTRKNLAYEPDTERAVMRRKPKDATSHHDFRLSAPSRRGKLAAGLSSQPERERAQSAQDENSLFLVLFVLGAFQQKRHIRLMESSMTVVHNVNTFGPTRMPEIAHVDSHGVRLSTHIESAATVVAATGEVDASNIERLTDCVRRAITGDRALILDLSKLGFFGAQGFQALFSIREECANAGVEWVVVASHPVWRLLRICDRDNRLPAVRSVSEAMQRLAGPSAARRLLQLVTKSG